MSDSPVIVEERGSIWHVRINAPRRRNALSEAVVAELEAVVARVARQKQLRAVILSGVGEKAFCAGADLKERRAMDEAEVRQFVGALNRMMRAIADSPKVWIAAIQGACLGGGLELAMCCDLRVARRDARIGLPEVRLGIIPGAGGTQRLARLIGLARAKELLLTGLPVSAERAEYLGLLNRVGDDHLAEADALAAEVAKCAPISLTQAKAAVDGGWDLHLEAGLCWERACYAVTIPTKDRLEALEAFAEKRAPIYKGE